MALAATSQNGWPTIPNYGDSRLKGLPWITGDVLAGDVWTVFDWLGRRFNAEVEPIVKASSWGYTPRAIIGSTATSNHASGTAVDFNADAHPLAASGTFSAAKVAAIRKIIADSVVDGTPVLRWGGDYSGRKDEMHFEINLQSNGNSPAKVASLAARVSGTPAATPATRETIRQGSTGAAVLAWTSYLHTFYPSYAGKVTPGTWFGADTKSATQEFQRRCGLADDGVVGPKTWAAAAARGLR